MKICEVTDKNNTWQQISSKNSIKQVENLETEITDYARLTDAVYSTTIINNTNLPGLVEIQNAIKNIETDLSNYPDQADPDIIDATSKIANIKTLLSKYK